MKRTGWVIFSAAAIVTIAMGVRQAFGLFLPDMSTDLSIGRSSFGLSLALQNLLFGLAQPFVGALADRHGAGRVVAGGTLLYAAGLIAASLAGSAIGLHLSFGLMVGMALSATTFVVVLGAVGRVVTPERRSMAFGIVTAGGSLGQFLVVPAGQLLIGELGWRMALVALAGLIAVMLALAVGVSGKPQAAGPQAGGAGQTLRQALGEAAGHRGFWLLNAGFFVCGFHVAFIATHFPAYLTDKGLGLAIGANALALVGLFNIFGSYLFGVWGGRWSKKGLLAALYAARGVVMIAFLVTPLTPASALLFAAAMGFLWLGTVPLTSGLVGQIFGMRYLSTLYGIVFLGHQLGSFCGAWIAGLMFDWTGSYDSIWVASVALGFIAALLHLPIPDRPVARVQEAAA
ncbi:MFS transporter [Sphingomonas sp.]|jgi:predicted MFS family arabinose efflux permease|uniref:MFS transporter n=1 Tax=Sphingomonas sp. TaxID=28214 RepID=UPI00262E8172|nr:MFS transporter [Sphingomonas sp.]MDK2766835.1 MFS transporter [Sphingomonas sp.]